jgi:predicted ATPase
MPVPSSWRPCSVAPQALRLVATSRHPLGVPGEQVWRVPGLDVAAPSDPSHLSALSGDPVGGAVELFIERATEATSAFDATATETREAVERICRWLDGMPLAIELAAARVPMLGVTQIAERLERDSGFLRRSNRASPARHRTLQAALEWSYQMLEPAEQRLFRMLGCFQGTFSLAATEAICADEVLSTDDILDLLSVLVDRSLVQVVEHPLQPRYSLLAIVRQYATEQLRDSGQWMSTCERHARYFLALAQDEDASVSGGEQTDWLQRVEREHDNLREALRWLIEESPEDAAQLASRLWPFWYRRGYYREARMYFEHALSSAAEISDRVVADVLTKAGEVAFLQCDYAIAIDHLQQARGVADDQDDSRGAATALQRLGSIAREQGRFAESRERHQQSLEIWQRLDDRDGVAASQNYLGFAAWLSDDPWTAESLCASALDEFQRSGNLQQSAGTLVNLGASALYRGELKLAGDRLAEALALSRRLSFQEGIAWSQHELAIAGRHRRRPLRENAALLREAVLVHRRLGDRWRVASVLEEIAGAVLARQDPRLAVELLAAADSLRHRLGTPIPPRGTPGPRCGAGAPEVQAEHDGVLRRLVRRRRRRSRPCD